MNKYYAQLDDTNLVLTVAVFDENTEPDESETWIETSDTLHKRRANTGDRYVSEADGYDNGIFHMATPLVGYESWVLNDDYEWEPPPDQPYPDGYGEHLSTWWWDPLIQQWDHKPPYVPGDN